MSAKIIDVVGRQLFVEKSAIPNAGLGLFTNLTIAQGRPICEYKGDLLTAEQVLKRYPDHDSKYLLNLFSPPIVDGDGNPLVIDADPERSAEIGYGGFANDRHMKYPQNIIEAVDRKAKLSAKLKPIREELLFSGCDVNKKMSKGNLRRWRKYQVKAVRGDVDHENALVKAGYNAFYFRLLGAPSYLLLSLRDIFAGEEIFVPYGREYWSNPSRNHNE